MVICKPTVRTVVGEDICALKMAVHQYNHCSMVLNDHKESKVTFFLEMTKLDNLVFQVDAVNAYVSVWLFSVGEIGIEEGYDT